MADDKMLAVISVIPGFGSTVLRGVGQAQAVNDLAASSDNCSSWRAFHTNAKNLARFDHLRNVHACLLVKIVDDSAVAWCRKRGATVFYDVLDNLGALHQLITLPPDQHLAVRFDVDVVLTQTQKLANHLGAHRAATLYHHQTNPGVVVPLERTRAEACLVGFMAGNKHNLLKKKTLEKLRRAMWTAAAGPPGHAARRIVFRVVEQGLDRDNSAAHLQRKDFKLPPSGSRSYWGGAAKCTGAPLPSEGSYEATPQAIFHNASAITAVDIALLWPPDSKGETMERPPTRLLYWLSHGVPAVVFGGYRSYAEIATAHNYGYLDPVTGKARLPLVRRAEEVTQVVRDLLQSATARLRLRKVGLEIAARYTALEVARRLTAILDQYCSRSIRSSEGSSSEGSKGSNSSSSSSSESKISRGDATGDGVEEPRRQPLESTSLPMTPTRDVNRRRQAPYDVLVSDAGLSPPASAATAAAAAAEAPPCVTPPLPPFELSGESEKPTVTVDLVTSCGGSSEMASLCVSVEKNRQNAARIMRSSFKTTPYAVAVNVVNVSNTTWPCLSAESALPKFALLRNIMTQRRNEFEGNANLRHHKHLIFWTDSDASFSNGANAPAIYRSLVKVSLRYHLVASHDKPTFPFLLCLGAFLLDVSPWSVQFVEAMLESGAARPTSIAIPNQDEHMYHAALRREASGGRLKARWRNHNYNHEIPPNILNWESCLAVENRSLLHPWVCRISLLKDQRLGLMFDCCWPEQSRINNLLLKTRAVISYVDIDERVTTSTRFGEVAILPAAVLNGRLNQSSSFSSTSLIIHMAGNQKSGLFEMVKEQFQAHLYAS